MNVLVLNSDLRIVFGHHERPFRMLNELRGQISEHLRLGKDYFCLNENIWVCFKRLNAEYLVVGIQELLNKKELQILQAQMSDLQAILQQLYPSIETNYFTETEKVMMTSFILFNLYLKIHAILDEVLF